MHPWLRSCCSVFSHTYFSRTRDLVDGNLRGACLISQGFAVVDIYPGQGEPIEGVNLSRWLLRENPQVRGKN